MCPFGKFRENDFYSPYPTEIRRKQKEIAEVGEKLKYSDPNLNIPFFVSKLEIFIFNWIKLYIKIGTICMTDKLFWHFWKDCLDLEHRTYLLTIT